MAELDRRDRLAGRETDVGGCGECFIAVHMQDGSVYAISGVATHISWERSNDWAWNLSGTLPLGNACDVTIHFPNGFVQEMRPMNGGKDDG